MKLDPAALRYLSDDDFRVLTAVEMGMRNHELVPIPLISSISGLRHGGYMKSLKEIHKQKLVHKETKRYVGYRLTTLGYDYLALRALVKRGVIESIGRSLGVGKEADVFVVSSSEELMDQYPELADQPYLAMKLHRLGRTSFRAVKSKRDYLVHRKSASWIYFSRLAAMKEYAFMCALHQRGFPVPRPMGQSRHVVIMEMCEGSLLNQVDELSDATDVARQLLEVIKRLARHGLVHCDLNEFNVMVDHEEGSVMVIDFPQMISTLHPDAEELFNRDVDGIRRFFGHKFGVDEADMPQLDFRSIVEGKESEDQIDQLVAASGFKTDNNKSEYGFQDLGEDADADQDEVNKSMDMESLQLSLPQEEKEGDDPDNSKRQVASSGSEDELDEEMKEQDDYDYEIGGSSINYTAIEARVRRQRGNKQQRKQFAKRNIVKDSEKRKVKVEMDCGVWQ